MVGVVEGGVDASRVEAEEPRPQPVVVAVLDDPQVGRRGDDEPGPVRSPAPRAAPRARVPRRRARRRGARSRGTGGSGWRYSRSSLSARGNRTRRGPATGTGSAPRTRGRSAVPSRRCSASARTGSSRSCRAGSRSARRRGTGRSVRRGAASCARTAAGPASAGGMRARPRRDALVVIAGRGRSRPSGPTTPDRPGPARARVPARVQPRSRRSTPAGARRAGSAPRPATRDPPSKPSAGGRTG